MQRRSFLTVGSIATGSLFSPSAGAQNSADQSTASSESPRISLALKIGMCADGASLHDKFAILQDLGYDGVELNSPGEDKKEAVAASKKLGFPIHGVVDSIHWRQRLSDPSAEIRQAGIDGLQQAIRESHVVGGSSVLLVPGVVDQNTSAQQAWDRAQEGIAQVLPLAARLGIHILIENVWNGMFYDPQGGPQQGAEHLAAFIDEIESSWVGSYFDIGNHQRFGNPAEWIRTLGKRIVKLDVKDWGVESGFGKIGEGDVDWPAVRTAIDEIGFTGWATAEVQGGDRARCAEILQNMRTHLLGV